MDTAHDPPAQSRSFWFVAWVAGGLGLVALTWVLSDLYFGRYFTERTFVLVNPPPGYHARRFWIERIPDIQFTAAAYALAGLWCFRSRGCAAVFWAAAVAGGSVLVHTAHGLGRL